jgi:branched-chain amino acid transport system substrate-binding protein
MAKVADANKTPILAAIATHPDITKENGFISHLCLDNRFLGITAALFVRDELLIDKVAVFINENRASSMDLASEFEEKFKSIGGEVTDTVVLAEETAELYEMIKRVYDHAPELLYLPIRAKDVLRVITEVQEFPWKPKMMGSEGLVSTMIGEYKKELSLVEGMLAIDFFSHEESLTPFGEMVKDVYEDMHKGKQRAASTAFSLLGIEGYALLVDAKNRCDDSAERECINKQIRSTVNFEGLTGSITIGSDGKAERPFYINSIQNGRSEFVVKVN